MKPDTPSPARASFAPITEEERVRAIFAERLGLLVPTDDTDVIASGLLDSLGVADLIMSLEEAFGIDLDVAALSIDDVRSVASITRLVARCGLQGRSE